LNVLLIKYKKKIHSLLSKNLKYLTIFAKYFLQTQHEFSEIEIMVQGTIILQQ